MQLNANYYRSLRHHQCALFLRLPYLHLYRFIMPPPETLFLVSKNVLMTNLVPGVLCLGVGTLFALISWALQSRFSQARALNTKTEL